jgi:hypothetical protein
LGVPSQPPAAAAAEPAPAAGYRVSGKIGAETTDALVICCSDRRYRRPMEHFLYKDLGLGNYDIIALPGGVYMLSFAEVLPKQLKLGMQMVKFVVKSHMPPRIVLVGHKDCGRYREGFGSWLKRPGFSLEEKQKHDMHAVAANLSETFSGVPVDAFYASPGDGESVVFARVS